MKLSNWGFKRKCVLNGAVVGESTGSCVSFRDFKKYYSKKGEERGWWQRKSEGDVRKVMRVYVGCPQF